MFKVNNSKVFYRFLGTYWPQGMFKMLSNLLCKVFMQNDLHLVTGCDLCSCSYLNFHVCRAWYGCFGTFNQTNLTPNSKAKLLYLNSCIWLLFIASSGQYFKLFTLVHNPSSYNACCVQRGEVDAEYLTVPAVQCWYFTQQVGVQHLLREPQHAAVVLQGTMLQLLPPRMGILSWLSGT